jgi:hypothetical protein
VRLEEVEEIIGEEIGRAKGVYAQSSKLQARPVLEVTRPRCWQAWLYSSGVDWIPLSMVRG